MANYFKRVFKEMINEKNLFFVYNNGDSFNFVTRSRWCMKYILVVDDEEDILETIVDSLEIEFDDVEVVIESAINGVDALRLINGERDYDVVVTDLNMPEMDGLELTQSIKKINKSMAVIVFTGHGDLEEHEELSSLGVHAMIKKPYVEELINEVTKCLGIV